MGLRGAKLAFRFAVAFVALEVNHASAIQYHAVQVARAVGLPFDGGQAFVVGLRFDAQFVEGALDGMAPGLVAVRPGNALGFFHAAARGITDKFHRNGVAAQLRAVPGLLQPAVFAIGKVLLLDVLGPLLHEGLAQHEATCPVVCVGACEVFIQALRELACRVVVPALRSAVEVDLLDEPVHGVVRECGVGTVFVGELG
ncbi:hypothetical protein D3C72_615240 [compost metagenome]